MTTTMNPTDRLLTLGEAVKLTGFSAGKFRYNKAKLEAAGVVITSDGWSIPVSVLNKLGWVGVKTPKGEVVETPLSIAQARIAELEAELAELRSHDKPRTSFFRRK